MVNGELDGEGRIVEHYSSAEDRTDDLAHVQTEERDVPSVATISPPTSHRKRARSLDQPDLVADSIRSGGDNGAEAVGVLGIAECVVAITARVRLTASAIRSGDGLWSSSEMSTNTGVLPLSVISWATTEQVYGRSRPWRRERRLPGGTPLGGAPYANAIASEAPNFAAKLRSKSTTPCRAGAPALTRLAPNGTPNLGIITGIVSVASTPGGHVNGSERATGWRRVTTPAGSAVSRTVSARRARSHVHCGRLNASGR